MDERTREWLLLLSEEQRRFDLASSTQDVAARARRTVLAREWLESISSVLKEYALSHVRVDSGGPLSPAPWESIHRAAAILENLSEGRRPAPIVDALKTVGAPGRWARERQGLALAIFYIEMAEEGLVSDIDPKSRIASMFQVSRRTVNRWTSDRSGICRGMDRPNPDHIEKFLAAAARDYVNNPRRGRKPKK